MADRKPSAQGHAGTCHCYACMLAFEKWLRDRTGPDAIRARGGVMVHVTGRSEMTDWCILRTASSQTLNLARSLAEDGFEVWTPAKVEQRRSRSGTKPEDVPIALVPSFVFAASVGLADLVALSHSPSLIYRRWDAALRRMVAHGHAKFSVFRHDGRHVLLPDSALAALRLAERRERTKAQVKQFTKGERVRLTEGGFEGLTGKVDRVQGQRTWVSFPGAPWSVEVPTWVLLPAIDAGSPVHVQASASEQALSAKAA